MPYQITEQPSASWKLNAISVPLVSVHTMRVSDSVVPESVSPLSSNHVRLGGEGGVIAGRTLLFLIAIILEDFRLQEDAIGFIFGFDENTVVILNQMPVTR